MNSIGIKEGQVIPSTRPACECEWLVLASKPPKYQLLKKCDSCIKEEKELAKPLIGENHQ